jgi:DNA-binding IscR family transcriptional regulator
MTHELWAGLNAHIFTYLRSITLAELVRQQTSRASEVSVLRDHRALAGGDRTPEPATT